MNNKLYILSFLLSFVVSAWAQPRFTSNTETYDFGQVKWKSPVSVTYTITNSGNKPLVLTSVEPDCACTVAEWTQTPIAPGQKGTLTVQFDAEALGRFNKSVAIYNNGEPHLAWVHFQGQVVEEVTDYSATHPYRIGDIRLDTARIMFPDVEKGQQPLFTLKVVNESSSSYEPVLMHLPPYLKAKAKPTVLQKGEKGEIQLSLLSDKLDDYGLIQTSVYLSRFAGDKVSSENEIPVEIVLIPNFSKMTTTERLLAPRIDLSASSVDIRADLAKKSKAVARIQLTNLGQTPLHISKVQVFDRVLGVNLGKKELKTNEFTQLTVKVGKKWINRLKPSYQILLITDDPTRPKVVIQVKAK